MSKLLILDLDSVDLETFLEEPNPRPAETVFGGYINGKIITIHDGVNRVQNAYDGTNSYNFRDNTINTIDNSD